MSRRERRAVEQSPVYDCSAAGMEMPFLHPEGFPPAAAGSKRQKMRFSRAGGCFFFFPERLSDEERLSPCTPGTKKGPHEVFLHKGLIFQLVAGTGFEPMTFGL